MTQTTTITHQPVIVFDFGGVLLDWNPRHLYRKLFPGDEAAMERFLVEIGFAEWNHLQDASLQPFSEAVAGLCARHPQYCDLIHAYDERFPETLGGAIPGTVEILDRLRQTGFSLFGLSNWSAEKFHQVRPHYEFFNWFQGMVISGEVKLIKPDPRIFQVLLGRSAARRRSACSSMMFPPTSPPPRPWASRPSIFITPFSWKQNSPTAGCCRFCHRVTLFPAWVRESRYLRINGRNNTRSI